MCQIYLDEADRITRHLDPYALDFPTCTNSKKHGRHERFMMKKIIDRVHTEKAKRLRGYFPSNYEPCEDSYTMKYVNPTTCRRRSTPDPSATGRFAAIASMPTGRART